MTISRLGLLVTHTFLHICTRVMTLDLHQNFIPAQYLENKLIDFHQILYMHLDWQGLGWDCYMSFSAHLYLLSYGSRFTPEFSFHSIPWEKNGRILPNFIHFVYALILTRSSLRLLHNIFRTFVPELWPLIYTRTLFLLNILRTNWQKLIKLYKCIHIDKI